MTLIIIRSAFTILMFGAFLGILFWAYNGRQRSRFDEAANLPFADEPSHQLSQQSKQHREP